MGFEPFPSSLLTLAPIGDEGETIKPKLWHKENRPMLFWILHLFLRKNYGSFLAKWALPSVLRSSLRIPQTSNTFRQYWAIDKAKNNLSWNFLNKKEKQNFEFDWMALFSRAPRARQIGATSNNNTNEDFPLHRACKEGDLPLVKKLILDGVPIDQPNAHDATPRKSL